jgi:hypothetical protein
MMANDGLSDADTTVVMNADDDFEEVAVPDDEDEGPPHPVFE